MPPNIACLTSCCSPTCDIAADDFDRGDDTDITTGSSCGWTETAGSWEIESNTLKTTSSNARALCGVTDSADAETNITVDVVGANANDEIIVIPKWKDASNYKYARLIVGTGKTLQVRQVLAGVDSLLASTASTTTAGTTYSLTVCYGNGTFSAYESVTGVVATYTSAAALAGYNSAVLGTGAITASVTFDNFDFDHGNTVAKPTCPVCSCTVTSDAFTRSNSTDIDTGSTAGWTEVAGDWSISGNALSISSADAIAVCSTDSPSDDVDARIDIASFSNTDKVRMLIDYQDDSNFIAGEVEKSATDSRLRIIQCASGVESVLRDVQTNASTQAELCFERATNRLWLLDSTTEASVLISPLTSRTVAVATGDTVSGAISLDNFLLRQSSPQCTRCPVCTNCADGAISDTLTVTLSGATNGGCVSCGSLTGAYSLDFYGKDLRVVGDCVWGYKFPSTICGFQYLYAQAILSGGNYQWFVYLSKSVQFTLSDWMRWTGGAQATPIDCNTPSVTCTYQADLTGECDFTSSTAVISSP